MEAPVQSPRMVRIKKDVITSTAFEGHSPDEQRDYLSTAIRSFRTVNDAVKELVPAPQLQESLSRSLTIPFEADQQEQADKRPESPFYTIEVSEIDLQMVRAICRVLYQNQVPDTENQRQIDRRHFRPNEVIMQAITHRVLLDTIEFRD